jgi:hypothetical protein
MIIDLPMRFNLSFYFIIKAIGAFPPLADSMPFGDRFQALA